LRIVRSDIRTNKIDVTGVQLIGTYPIKGPGTADVDVVQVFYSRAALSLRITTAKVFVAPPATEVQCLNPAFA
jgi:hypothetical protein